MSKKRLIYFCMVSGEKLRDIFDRVPFIDDFIQNYFTTYKRNDSL